MVEAFLLVEEASSSALPLLALSIVIVRKKTKRGSEKVRFDVNLTLFGILRVTGTRYEERVDGDDNKEDTRTHALALQEEEVTTFLLDCVPFEVIKVPNINLFSSKSKRPNTIDSSKDNKTLLNSSINNYISFNRT